jgi:hypothetical protein
MAIAAEILREIQARIAMFREKFQKVFSGDECEAAGLYSLNRDTVGCACQNRV